MKCLGYNPTNLDKINSRKETLINIEELHNIRDCRVIEAFENGVFPFKDECQERESDMSNKTRLDWVNVDKKGLIR